MGQTTNKLITRFQANWQTIDNKQVQYDVAKDFNRNQLNGIKDMKIYTLDFIYVHSKSEIAKSL